jgi:acetoin utilization protein AcuC
MPSRVAICYRAELQDYDFGAGHPFRGRRFPRFYQFMTERLPAEQYELIAADLATDDDLLRICSREYIEFSRDFYRAAHEDLGYDGRFYEFHSADNLPRGSPGRLEEAARLIVGQAKRAADLVLSGTFEKAISIGGGLHHAKRSFGEGFCLYNDVAFVATYLLEVYGLERILIVDTDAHAGNGTAGYFYRDPRVLFIDLHQDPRTIYPGTGFVSQIGAGEGEGYTVNVPLPLRAGYESYQHVFDALVEPLAEEFKPQVVVRNGGSDPYFNDQLTQLGLPLNGFSMIGKRIRAIAELCDGKEIDLIASGYNERILPFAWLALIAGIAGLELALEEPEPVPEMYRTDMAVHATEQVVRAVKAELQASWRCFQ